MHAAHVVPEVPVAALHPVNAVQVVPLGAYSLTQPVQPVASLHVQPVTLHAVHAGVDKVLFQKYPSIHWSQACEEEVLLQLSYF